MTVRLDLFRAVEPAELRSIILEGRLTNLPGNEAKYFALTLTGVQQFVRMAMASLDLGPFTLVQTSIDEMLVLPEFRVQVDRGILSVVLPTELLSCCAIPLVLDDKS